MFNLLTSATLLVPIAYLYIKYRQENRLPLPPGPPKLPLIGNMLDIPSNLQWITYHKWCKELDSDIIHLDMAGNSIIILGTAEAAMELLERRSSIYSSRRRFPMIGELMGWDFNFGNMPYGDRWRQHRRLMHQAFHPTAAIRFHPHELKATHGLLRRLLDEPDDLFSHLQHMAGETIMSIAYGLEIQPKDDPYIEAAERAMRPVAKASVPGAFWVDAFPILKYVPDWMPFAGFKRLAKECHKATMEMVNIPFEVGKRNINSGNFTPSFISHNLEEMDANGDLTDQEYVIKSTAGSMYTAAFDTTMTAIASAILALLTHPEVFQNAQREIDQIVGSDRLPNFDDRDSLPYITAIVKEAFRWRDVVPMGAPHFIHVEDEYKGYRIPAGSTIMANCWAMLHNEDVYADPFEFNPNRFIKDGKLNPAVKDPSHAAFGFGRRICPGRYMAVSAVWIAIASFIAAFDLTKCVDENGEVIEPSQEYESSFIYKPLPFKCSIKARSKQAEDLVRATASGDY